MVKKWQNYSKITYNSERTFFILHFLLLYLNLSIAIETFYQKSTCGPPQGSFLENLGCGPLQVDFL